ncbi:uncharacterized protein LOC132700962 [Cylas formicarius]|uniref:uncharacterized protein LOC132700962 n=1 Tax=Cylas formicarius TaxID=197179 RepID=UPI0029586B2B|nr:uncharacterized protein LOC132700962 [Cylas formicarius]
MTTRDIVWVIILVMNVFASTCLCDAARQDAPADTGVERDELDVNINEIKADDVEEMDEAKFMLEENGGGKKGGHKKEKKGLMEKMMPMMVIPFLISSALIPFMLMSLKFLLMKSALIGKVAIVLLLLNFLRNRGTGGGVFSHNVNVMNDVAHEHYGYQGHEEYGAYVNRKRRKRAAKNTECKIVSVVK